MRGDRAAWAGRHPLEEWEPVDRVATSGPRAGDPTLETVIARDGTAFTGTARGLGVEGTGALIYLHGGPEGQSRPDDDGHQIAKLANRSKLTVLVRDWLGVAFAAGL